MKWKKSDLLILGALLVPTILFFFVYPSLPELVPTSWNFRFEIRAWSNKSSLIFLALLGPFLWVFFHYLPFFAPKRRSYMKNERAWKVIVLISSLLMQAILWGTVAIVKGLPVNMKSILSFALAFFLIIGGNYMGKVQHNYFIGIRTPWTLASEENWKKTHRFAGKTMTISGLLLLVANVLLPYPWLPIFFVFAGTMLPVLYSLVYFLKNKEES